MSGFTWRQVEDHPPLEICVHQIDRSLWKIFKRHHYLSAEINSSAQCFGGFIGHDLVAFMAYIHFPHPKAKNIKMGHRTVVLPDYQGLGISGRMSEVIGQHLYGQGFRYRRVIAHPAVIAYCQASPRWRETTAKTKSVVRWSGAAWDAQAGRTPVKKIRDPRALGTRSFEYKPPREAQ